MKKFVGYIVVILLSVAIIVLCILGYNTKTEDTGYTDDIPHIPTVEELDLSEDIDPLSVGLFYYDGDVAKPITDDNLNINSNKPIIIFTHGMKFDGGYALHFNFGNYQYWQEEGFNTFVWRWGPFSDDQDPIAISNKEWSGKTSPVCRYAYENEQGKRAVEETDVPRYSMAEMFGAYYNELTTKYAINSPDIRFMGHSMGGQMTMAIGSYIKTMIEKGAIDKKYMFTRLTMLDPYLDSVSNSSKIDWLDRTIGNGGSASLVLDIAKELSEIGIPVEYIKSGLADILARDKSVKNELKEVTTYIEMDTTFIVPPEDMTDPVERYSYKIEQMHEACHRWYRSAITTSYYDKTVNNINYAVGPSTPTSCVMAQNEGYYNMEENLTECDVTDDVIYSTGKESTIVSGYAFFDKNNNGLNDDTYANRLSGVKINLFCDGEKIGSYTTKTGGYYQFSLESKYANRNLQIKVENISPTKIAVGEGYLAMTGNGINQNGESDIFRLSEKEIKIINIGKI